MDASRLAGPPPWRDHSGSCRARDHYRGDEQSAAQHDDATQPHHKPWRKQPPADATAAASPSPSVLLSTSSPPAVNTPSKSSAPAALIPAAPVTTTQPVPARTAQAPALPPPSTQAPPPRPSTCGAPSSPYSYNFCGTGSFVSSPPGDICNYFNCINNFWNGHGYMVECNDGNYSMSGGVRGACSYHGGEDRPV